METTEGIIRWSASHWGALAVIATVTLGIMGSAINRSAEVRHRVCRGLAVVVALIYLADSTFIAINHQHGSWEQNLPLHFCSFMLMVAVFALWTRKQAACWLLYFGALTICLQGLITPALEQDFPAPRYFMFFCLHGILMPAALAVPLLLKMRARLRDVIISQLLMNAYLAFIHPVNLLLGTTNYGFTMESPVPGCILDYAGPAPWYYLALQLPAFAAFCVLYLPVRQTKRGLIPSEA